MEQDLDEKYVHGFLRIHEKEGKFIVNYHTLRGITVLYGPGERTETVFDIPISLEKILARVPGLKEKIIRGQIEVPLKMPRAEAAKLALNYLEGKNK